LPRARGLRNVKMCGICGILDSRSSDDLQRLGWRMTETLSHRGPDDAGIYLGPGVVLGHRRLSIIELSDAGAQPMTLGSSTVVYNGEAYNFRELRAELQQLGHEFRGHSDTEVLLHAYQAWGLRGLERLEGIFAFALWDGARSRLVLMRDRLGVKPLFYAWHGQRLAFGSEIKAVFAGVQADRSTDEQAFREYLWYGNAFEDRTLYRGVRALEPGWRLIAEGNRTRLERWWRLESWLGGTAHTETPEEAANAVRGAVDAAVTRQLVSDVPVGIFLSGGLDSSSIAASATRASGRRLSSFSVGFDYQRGINELPKARAVAQKLGLEHHELHVAGGQLAEVLDALVSAHDEPFADAANIPLYLLSAQLRGRIKVVLQGDGGDEMFGGYRRYSLLRAAHLWRLWPHGLDARLQGSRIGKRLARLGTAAGSSDPALRMALLLTVETLRDPPTRVLRSERRAPPDLQPDPFLAFRRCAERFADADPVQQMLLTDLSLQLPAQFLAKVDRATMANGIEARVPLLDEQVGALAVGMPSALKVSMRQKKIVLREAMRRRLPVESWRGPKTGFGVPYEEWLRTSLFEYARAQILADTFIERFRLDRSALDTALAEHRARLREHGFLLWKLFQLALWSRKYLP
jgi:asparagine synthase (glutamine-hydrolysing)